MDWYPDPADATRERYWDGERWTHNTRPAQVAPTAPPADPWAAAPTQAPVAAPQQEAPQPGYGPYQGAAPMPGQPAQPWQAPAGPAAQTADGVPLSGWGRRAVAWIIDSFLISAVSALLGWNFVSRLWHGFQQMMQDIIAEAQSGNTTQVSGPEMVERYGLTGPSQGLQLITFAVTLAYLLLLWRFLGATLGQKLLGIRVVPVDQGRAHSPLGWGRAAARAGMFSLLSLIPLVALVNYLLPLWTSKRQTLHDMAGRTQVVRSR